MVSRKKGPKSYSKKDMLSMGYEFRGNYAKHRFIYALGNRKGIVVNSRKKDEQEQQELAFDKTGQLVLFNKHL